MRGGGVFVPNRRLCESSEVRISTDIHLPGPIEERDERKFIEHDEHDRGL